MENNANQLNSMLCKRNCGFFGNAAYDGYCSKCYKDHVKRQNSGSAAGRVTPTTSTSSQAAAVAAAVAAAQQQQLQQNEIHASLSTTESMNVESVEQVVQPAVTTIPITATTTTTTTTTSTQPIAIPARVTFSTETVSPSASTTDLNPQQQAVKFNLDSSSSSCMEQISTMPPPAQPSSQQQPLSSASNALSSPQLSTSLMSDDSMLMSTSLPAVSALAATSTASGGGDGTTPPGTEKKKRTRCCVESCKRKVGLTGFDCRCGGLYCWEHRYSDKHDCKFDYKELGQDQIRKNNPIVVGEKIQKI